MTLDISDRVVTCVAIAGVTVLGGIALFIQGDASTTMLVGVSAFLGALARHVWPDTAVPEVKQ